MPKAIRHAAGENRPLPRAPVDRSRPARCWSTSSRSRHGVGSGIYIGKISMVMPRSGQPRPLGQQQGDRSPARLQHVASGPSGCPVTVAPMPSTSGWVTDGPEQVAKGRIHRRLAYAMSCRPDHGALPIASTGSATMVWDETGNPARFARLKASSLLLNVSHSEPGPGQASAPRSPRRILSAPPLA